MSSDLNKKLEHSNQAYFRTTVDDIPESIGDHRNDDSGESDHDVIKD